MFSSLAQRIAAALVVMTFILLTGCTDQMLTETPSPSESTEVRTSNTWNVPPTDLTESDTTETDTTDFEDDSDWGGSTQRIIQRF